MKRHVWLVSILFGALCGSWSGGAIECAMAPPLTIGVSWFRLAEERWQFDESGIKAVLNAHGAHYIAADAHYSTEKAVADVDDLIARGVDALIIVAGVSGAIEPAVRRAVDAGLPVIAYDQLIEVPGTFYVSFDARAVGQELAKGMLQRAPEGHYALIKGDQDDPNTQQMFDVFMAVMQPAVAAGKIDIVGEHFVDKWRPEGAKTAIERILTANHNHVDAVMVMNDGMAAAVASVLDERGLHIPISGQDGAPSALNRIARGQQAFTVWKDAYALGQKAAAIALALARGQAIEEKIRFDKGPQGMALDAVLLPVQLIDRHNLQVVVARGWATKARICTGVTAEPPPLCK